MKKLFVSLQMNGRPDHEILADMNSALEKAKDATGEELELIDSFIQVIPEDLEDGNSTRLYCLGNSIRKLATADYIYFAGDWWNGKATRIEYLAAELYGKTIIFEDPNANPGLEWARNEAYIAIKEAAESETGDEDETQARAFRSALAGFQIFLLMADQNHELGWDLGVAALRQLTNRLPLTAVGNHDDDWIGTEEKDGCRYFVHKRLDTLFKMVDQEGREHFVDTERCHCIDIRDKKKKYYSGGWGERVFNASMPITFPYYPDGKWTVYTEEFRCYEDSEESDTFGVIGYRSPQGEMMEVMQFFKKNPETKEWEYIQKTEYASRMKKATALQKKKNKLKQTENGEQYVLANGGKINET